MALLFLATERVDRIHHQSALHRSEGAHAGITALELVHDQPVRDVVQSYAAVFLRQIGAKHPQLRHLRNQLFRKSSVYVAIADDGENLLIDEGSYGIADRALL